MISSSQPIAVLCGGGDCPGLNAVIRAVTKTAILQYGCQVFGSEDSFDGFLQAEKMRQLTLDSVQGILPRGGTILGTTNRGNPFRYPIEDRMGQVHYHDYSGRIIERFHQLGLTALIMIGGDGTLAIGQRLFEAGLPVVGVPKTIDNDLLATEVTFGFDTAVTTATEAIDKIHTTAESHDRVMVVEVMGRNSGWIALHAGVAGGADLILIPEIPFRLDEICQKLQQRRRQGNSFSVVVVAEGAAPEGGKQTLQTSLHGHQRLGGVGALVAHEIQQRCHFDTRCLVLGHLQRGGSPTAYDRLLSTRFGNKATHLALGGQFGQMVCLKCGRIESVAIKEAIARQRTVHPQGEEVQASRALGISFGGRDDSHDA